MKREYRFTLIELPAVSWVKKSFFTLIELLVVIAIIAILASILFPALKKAREKGNEISCLNNVKQISTAVHSYADDYNGWFPTNPYSDPSNKISRIGWDAMLLRYLGRPDKFSKDHDGVTYYYPDLWNGPPIFHCPKGKIASGQTDASSLGYGFNVYVYYDGVGWNPGGSPQSGMGKMGRIPQASNLALLFEIHNPATWEEMTLGGVHTNTGFVVDINSTALAYRHSNGMNVGFADGHAAYRKAYASLKPREVIYYWDSGGSPVWSY